MVSKRSTEPVGTTTLTPTPVERFDLKSKDAAPPQFTR